MLLHDRSDDWHRVAGADGTSIAWTVGAAASEGAGTPSDVPVVLCNGIACSDAYWYGVAPLLEQARPVVRWDYRGHGRSGPPVDATAVEVADNAADLARVVDAAGLPRTVLVGHSYGVQVALEGQRILGDRVAAVVAVAGAASRPLTRGGDTTTRETLLTGLQRFSDAAPALANRTWDAVWDSTVVDRLARVLGGSSSAAPPEVMRAYYDHVRRRDTTVLFAMLQAMQRYDGDAVVTDLPVPLLVLAGDRDGLTPLSVLRRMALAAPLGELAVRHGGAHTLPAEYPRWVASEIERFLTHGRAARHMRQAAAR